MPVYIITGNLVVEHSHSWSFLVNQDSDECSNAVALLLAPTTDIPAGYNYGKHVEALAKVLGQKVLQSAKSGPRQAIYKHLLSRGGYEVIIMCLQPRPTSGRYHWRLSVNQNLTAAIAVRRVMKQF